MKSVSGVYLFWQGQATALTNAVLKMPSGMHGWKNHVQLRNRKCGTFYTINAASRPTHVICAVSGTRLLCISYAYLLVYVEISSLFSLYIAWIKQQRGHVWQTSRSLWQHEVTVARKNSQVRRNFEQSQYLVFTQDCCIVDGSVEVEKWSGLVPSEEAGKAKVSESGYLARTNYPWQMLSQVWTVVGFETLKCVDRNAFRNRLGLCWKSRQSSFCASFFLSSMQQEKKKKKKISQSTLHFCFYGPK